MKIDRAHSDSVPFFESLTHEAAPEQAEKKLYAGPHSALFDLRQLVGVHTGHLARADLDQALVGIQGTWTMALGACLANDEDTSTLLVLCLRRGLAIEDVVKLAIVANSDRAAEFLTQQGVDWKTQKVGGDLDPSSGRSVNLFEPIEFIMMHDMGGGSASYAKKIKRSEMQMGVFEALTMAMQNPSLRFFEGVLKSGQIQASDRIPTRALGLKDGHASVLAHCVACREWTMVQRLIDVSAPLSQEALDEALLACAMVLPTCEDEDIKPLGKISAWLRKKGASPDKMFEFGAVAQAHLQGWSSVMRDEPGRMTARQWALYGALRATAPSAWEKALLSSPWPSLENSTWPEHVEKFHLQTLLNAERKQAFGVWRKVLGTLNQENMVSILTRHGEVFEGAMVANKPAVIDAFIDYTTSLKNPEPVPLSLLAPMVAAGLDKAVNDSTHTLQTHMTTFFNHDRMERLIEWVDPQEQGAFRHETQALRSAYQLHQNASQPSQRQALLLAMTTFKEALLRPQVHPPRPRRTL